VIGGASLYRQSYNLSRFLVRLLTRLVLHSQVGDDPEVRTEIARLSGREAATLHELAAEYGVSAERIRQIEVKALQKMKGALAASV